MSKLDFVRHDRQMRVLGLDAQRLICASTILVYDVSLLTMELSRVLGALGVKILILRNSDVAYSRALRLFNISSESKTAYESSSHQLLSGLRHLEINAELVLEEMQRDVNLVLAHSTDCVLKFDDTVVVNFYRDHDQLKGVLCVASNQEPAEAEKLGANSVLKASDSNDLEICDISIFAGLISHMILPILIKKPVLWKSVKYGLDSYSVEVDQYSTENDTAEILEIS